MKKIAVFGITGSIGTQALDVIKKIKDYQLVAVSCGKNIKLLEDQIDEFKPRYVCVQEESDLSYLSKKFKDIEFFCGSKGLNKISRINEYDLVLNAVSGFAGLEVSLGVIENSGTLLLANKESIICGSRFLMNLCKEKNAKIRPVDSEHSAIWQCLDKKKQFVDKLILTASGGPFFGMERKNLKNVSVNQVLKHPTWKMGAKISVNSANMMNKGMEIIEACYLFDVPISKIEVLIHPQSVIHSMVEFVDGNILAQMSNHSMEFPIQYAITYPKRLNISHGNLHLSEIKNLSFYPPSIEDNKILNLWKEVSKNGSMSCALNAINEEAVDAFLKGGISFLDLEEVSFKGIEKFTPLEVNSVGDIIESDRIGREIAKEILSSKT